jgi:hypothetical protein
MLLSIKVNQFILEGSEMKTGRFLVLLALVIGLLAGPWQAPVEAEMLGRVGQLVSLYYNNGSWYQIKPDGSNTTFALAPGQSYIMTSIGVRFYVTDPATQTGPYRFYLLGPQSSRMFIANFSDLKYPGSDTVWGGGINPTDTNTQPGVAFSVLPTPQVTQIPSPPADPNSGPARSGTFYMTVRGFVVP